VVIANCNDGGVSLEGEYALRGVCLEGEYALRESTPF
jgi:hypothetical protein